MKYILSFLMSLFFFVGYSQNYVLDTSFGNAGKIKLFYQGTFPRIPVEVFFVNDKYITVQKDIISGFNYNGSTNTNFGTNGVLSLPSNFTIVGAKLFNQFIYFFGKTLQSNNDVSLIGKISLDGVLDNSFGNGGIALFNISTNNVPNDDIFNDIIINQNQTIYAIGSTFSDGYKYVLARITPTQTLDTTFNSIGYKFFEDGKGLKMLNYQGGILLVGVNSGTIYVNGNPFPGSFIRLAKVDYNGNTVTSFGSNGNGIQVLSNPNVQYPELKNAYVFANNKLYLSYIIGGAGSVFGLMQVYDLQTMQETNLFYQGRESRFSELAGKLYIADGTCAYCSSENFRVKRFNSDGSPDLTFNATGEYTFSFGGTSLKDYVTAMYVHEDGKIYLGGSTGSGSSFGMIRIMDSSLSLSQINQNANFVIFPNPSSEKIYIKNESNYTIDQIKIIDVTGKIVHNRDNNFDEIDISAFSNGLYFINVSYENKNETIKFLKR